MIIPCVVSGKPEVEVLWYRNNRIINNDGRSDGLAGGSSDHSCGTGSPHLPNSLWCLYMAEWRNGDGGQMGWAGSVHLLHDRFETKSRDVSQQRSGNIYEQFVPSEGEALSKQTSKILYPAPSQVYATIDNLMEIVHPIMWMFLLFTQSCLSTLLDFCFKQWQRSQTPTMTQTRASSSNSPFDFESTEAIQSLCATQRQTFRSF